MRFRAETKAFQRAAQRFKDEAAKLDRYGRPKGMTSAEQALALGLDRTRVSTKEGSGIEDKEGTLVVLDVIFRHRHRLIRLKGLYSETGLQGRVDFMARGVPFRPPPKQLELSIRGAPATGRVDFAGV